ncbi:MAG: NAD(P)H-hydrate dehydratase [Planctomycetota bacterium]
MSELPESRLPSRDPQGHKVSFGRVAVIGGCLPEESEGAGSLMLGGPALAASAALRAGAGLVELALPRELLTHALTVCPSATGRVVPQTIDGAHAALLAISRTPSVVLAVGPALGTSHLASAITAAALEQHAAPVVLDADALNAVARDPGMLDGRRCPHLVLTPHLGEAARLAEAIDLDYAANDFPKRLAHLTGATVVLKSAATIITDGSFIHRFDRPNPALATGGSGDVLAGIVASFLAQHIATKPVPELAAIAVRVHNDAARSWCETNHATGGMLASDLLAHLPGAIESRRFPARQQA